MGNYLSLKAYAVTASEKLSAYVAKGKGKNLSSLGDLLVNIAFLSDVDVEAEEGISPTSEIPQLFSNGKVKVDNSVSKINGLVHEYITTVNSCRERWPMGLGKYLLLKLEASMTKKGVLQVDKVEGLAVRMAHYEGTLAKLTAALTGKAKKAAPHQV